MLRCHQSHIPSPSRRCVACACTWGRSASQHLCTGPVNTPLAKLYGTICTGPPPPRISLSILVDCLFCGTFCSRRGILCGRFVVIRRVLVLLALVPPRSVRSGASGTGLVLSVVGLIRIAHPLPQLTGDMASLESDFAGTRGSLFCVCVGHTRRLRRWVAGRG